MLNSFSFSKFTPPPLAPGEEPPAGAVCYENIGPRERRVRALYGHAAFGLALVLTAALLLAGAAWWWRLLVFPLFAAAAANWLQVRERT